MQLSTIYLSDVLGKYVLYVLLMCTCYTCALPVAVAQPLPLLPPLLPPSGQLVHEIALLLLIKHTS